MPTSQQAQSVIATPVSGTGVQLVPWVAAGTLTLNGTPNDGDQFSITIDNIAAFVYTFKTTLTPSAGQVLIGGSAAAAILNLYQAMTGGPGSGTAYAAGTSPCANQTTAAILALIISGQPGLWADVPNSSNAIVLRNGPGWSFAISAPTNVSTNLAVSAANLASSNANARKRPGYLHMVNVRPAAANATLLLYDSAQVTGAASGNVLCYLDAASTWSNLIDYNGRKQFVNGLYAVLTTTGGSFEVMYE